MKERLARIHAATLPLVVMAAGNCARTSASAIGGHTLLPHLATWAVFGGFGKSKKTPVVSAFVEQRSKVTRVRLNFVMAKTKSHVYGMSSSDEEPITKPAVYQEAFEQLDKALFVRLSMDGSATGAAPAAAPVAVPAAAPVPVPAAATPPTE